MHDFNLFILNYLAAYANRAQWQGDGCEVCRRIAKDRNWQSWSHVEGVGSAKQGVHRDEVRRIQLQRPGDHRWLGIDHHQRTLRQEDSLLGHEKLGVARERDRAAGKSHLAWFIERFVSRRVIHWFIQPANLTSFPPDCNYLAACVRDDTIKIIDLRVNKILTSLSHDNYKVACDFARISLNVDSSHVAAGASDGSIFIWNVNGSLVEVLKDHT